MRDRTKYFFKKSLDGVENQKAKELELEAREDRHDLIRQGRRVETFFSKPGNLPKLKFLATQLSNSIFRVAEGSMSAVKLKSNMAQSCWDYLVEIAGDLEFKSSHMRLDNVWIQNGACGTIHITMDYTNMENSMMVFILEEYKLGLQNVILTDFKIERITPNILQQSA